MRLLRLLLPLLAATVLVVAGGAPAWAHGGAVDVSIVGRSVDGSTVSYTVALTYQNDGHPVIGSGVGVDASGPGGSRHAALRAVGATGRYAGSIELGPGSWTVHFVNEEGDLTITQQVGPVATTVPPTTRPPTTEPPRTTVPRTVPRSPATTSPTTV